jgi:phosphotriesterase-related protein
MDGWLTAPGSDGRAGVAMAQVQTVTGWVSASEMGITLPHEHIFVDMRPTWSKPDREDKLGLVDAHISLEIMGSLMHDMAVCKENLVLDDPDAAAGELRGFQSLGGKTIVDVTTRGLSPNPSALRDLSRRLGLNIVAGTGYYTARTHPPDVVEKTEDQLAEEMIRDAEEGFQGGDVKAGIIGELGISHPIADNEKKVLQAAAHAQRSTGLAISVHLPWKGKHAPTVIHTLESQGVDPRRIIIDHMDDMEDMTFEYHRTVAEHGVYLEFDCFGQEDYVEEQNFIHPRDIDRITALKRLVDIGYIDSILLSQDVCLKTYTRKYGGYGYGHILRTIIPMMKRNGLTETEINYMMIQNPARVLAC